MTSFSDRQSLAPTAGEGSRFSFQALEAGASGKFAQSSLAIRVSNIRIVQGILKHAADRDSRCKSRFLRYVSSPRELAYRHLARVRTNASCQDGEQSRFAGAVWADQANARPILNRE